MDYVALVQQFGPTVGGLLFIVWLLYTDRVVSGRRYREVVAQRDRLLKLALSGQKRATQATNLGEALGEALVMALPPEGGGDRDDSGD